MALGLTPVTQGEDSLHDGFVAPPSLPLSPFPQSAICTLAFGAPRFSPTCLAIEGTPFEAARPIMITAGAKQLGPKSLGVSLSEAVQLPLL